MNHNLQYYYFLYSRMILYLKSSIHDEMHAMNDEWFKGEGPLHDSFAESMFLRLKKLHNEKCLHVDIKYTSILK